MPKLGKHPSKKTRAKTRKARQMRVIIDRLKKEKKKMMKFDIASVEEKEVLKAARGAEDIYLWKDSGGAVIRVFTLKAQPAVLFELENDNAVRSFVFDTPGDFGDFVAVMTGLAKEVYGLDFSKNLNIGDELVTSGQLVEAMPRLKKVKNAPDYIGPLNLALIEFGIGTHRRVAAFIAQIAHESGELKYMEEIWGPTAAQKRYEGREDLGNTQPGDGYKYRGRGVIQLTGKSNYKKYGDLLGIDLVDDPDLAARPDFAFRLAGCFWKTHGLNELADSGTEDDFKSITRKINGGLTHLKERMDLWERAKKVFNVE